MSLAETHIRSLADESPACPVVGGVYGRIKPALEGLLALALLILLAPLMIVLMLAVRLGSRGPAIYSQRRVGLHGRVFTIYKIRTMYQDSEAGRGAVWCVPGDPRITPLGRLLRFTHLDELPQLINVLMGEMSLVGPRPERPEFLPELEENLPGYRRRLAVRPGVTGLAQVQQAPDTNLESVRRKLNFDLCYVERMSPWLDLRIIAATGLKCLGVPFAWIGRLLMLPDPNAGADGGSILQADELAYRALVAESRLG